MHKFSFYLKYLCASVLALVCLSSHAQTNVDLTLLSPKLRDFLGSHLECRKLFLNTVNQTSQGRQFTIFYFYTTDESIPRAYHYYQSASNIGLVVRENQQAIDEFICIVFELMNSENQSNFDELAHLAAIGEISRKDFPLKIVELEFSVEKQLRDLLPGLNLSEKDTNGSHYYKLVTACPNEFSDYLKYLKKTEPLRDPIKEYEIRYDSLQNNVAH